MECEMEKVQAALDRDQIRELIYRYCRGIDRLDGELARSVFHADATDDHGRYEGSSIKYMEEALRRAGRNWLGSQHRIANINIEVCGDIAFCESYLHAYHILPGQSEAAPILWLLAGRYIDRFERRGARWGIAHRIVVKDWQHTQVLHDAGGYGFLLQRRDKFDMSYQRMEPFSSNMKVREKEGDPFLPRLL